MKRYAGSRGCRCAARSSIRRTPAAAQGVERCPVWRRHGRRRGAGPVPCRCQELAHGGIGTERLRAARCGSRRRRAGPRRRPCSETGLAVHQGHPQRVAVHRQGGVDVLDGDADVVERRQHGTAGDTERGVGLFPDAERCGTGRVQPTAAARPQTARRRADRGGVSGTSPMMPVDAPCARAPRGSSRVVGERVHELGAVGAQHDRGRGPEGLISQLGAPPASRTRRVASGGALRRSTRSEARAASPSRTRTPSRGRSRPPGLQVVGGAGGDRAEHQLLGRPAAQQHGHEVDQLLARLCR